MPSAFARNLARPNRLINQGDLGVGEYMASPMSVDTRREYRGGQEVGPGSQRGGGRGGPSQGGGGQYRQYVAPTGPNPGNPPTPNPVTGGWRPMSDMGRHVKPGVPPDNVGNGFLGVDDPTGQFPTRGSIYNPGNNTNLPLPPPPVNRTSSLASPMSAGPTGRTTSLVGPPPTPNTRDNPGGYQGGSMEPPPSWTSDPGMYQWYMNAMAQQHPNQTPMAFDVDLSRLSPEEQNKFLAAQGRKLWQDRVNAQQMLPGKGGSQPLPQGGLAVSTPGIPGADDPYWIQQARRARFDYNRGLDRKYRETGHGHRGPNNPPPGGNLRWNPTTRRWEPIPAIPTPNSPDNQLQPAPRPPNTIPRESSTAMALSAPSAIEMAQSAPGGVLQNPLSAMGPYPDPSSYTNPANARYFGSGNYDPVSGQAHGPADDPIARAAAGSDYDYYGGAGGNPFSPMRYVAAAHDRGDPAGRSQYAPGYLMNAARRAQQPGGPVPRGMDFLRNAPIMTMGGPQAQSIRDWYMRASAMQGDPGAYVPPV